jgi:FkbM family methyltransferase
MLFTSYVQNLEDVMLWRALRDVGPGFYIDIGAQDPLVDSVSLAFHERGWRGIHVEPNAQFAELLWQQRPGDVVVQAAVGDVAGLITLHVIPGSGLSTADPDIAAQHRQRGFDVQTTTVPSLRLSAIFDACGSEEIHWLKLDIEGFEATALSSWGNSPRRPWIVVVESTLPLTQIESSTEWEPMLLKRGYEPVYFDGLNRFYLAGDRSSLRADFAAPPNYFDHFAVNGTASTSLHELIEKRHEEAIAALTAGHEAALHELNASIQHLTSALNDAKSLPAQAEQALARLSAELEQARISAPERGNCHEPPAVCRRPCIARSFRRVPHGKRLLVAACERLGGCFFLRRVHRTHRRHRPASGRGASSSQTRWRCDFHHAQRVTLGHIVSSDCAGAWASSMSRSCRLRSWSTISAGTSSSSPCRNSTSLSIRCSTSSSATPTPCAGSTAANPSLSMPPA